MGLIALVIEFILGLFIENGIKLEDALQEQGLGWLIPVALLVIVLLCVGLFCLAGMLLLGLTAR